MYMPSSVGIVPHALLHAPQCPRSVERSVPHRNSGRMPLTAHVAYGAGHSVAMHIFRVGSRMGAPSEPPPSPGPTTKGPASLPVPPSATPGVSSLPAQANATNVHPSAAARTMLRVATPRIAAVQSSFITTPLHAAPR